MSGATEQVTVQRVTGRVGDWHDSPLRAPIRRRCRYSETLRGLHFPRSGDCITGHLIHNLFRGVKLRGGGYEGIRGLFAGWRWLRLR